MQRPKSHAAAIAGAAIAFGSGATALADQFAATRSAALVEKEHRVELRYDRGFAELVVQRTVRNGGPRHDQATWFIDLPEGAVAVGLRTLGTLHGKPHWFDGELLEAEAAAARYRELTGIGGYYPKDPALLSWRSQSRLALQVFPCPPGEDKSVEYTLRLPTSYSGGREHVHMGSLGTSELPAEIHVRPAHAGDTPSAEGKALAPGDRLRIAPGDAVDLALARADAPRLDGTLAVVPFGPRRALFRYRVNAAPSLSEVPRGAHVVVLLDGSRSLSVAEAEAQRAAARAYLAHFAARGGRAQVATFDRRVRPHHRGFVSIAAALSELDGPPKERRNGSHLDDALAWAERALDRVPARAPQRIVLFTDLRTRSSLRPDGVRVRGPGSPILHIATVRPGEPGVRRDDGDGWAGPARATGGLLFQASATRDPTDAERMHAVYEELVRPLRVDRLVVRAPGVEVWAPDALDEGEGLEDLRITDRAAPWLSVTGEIWSKPIRKVLRPSEAEGRLWAGLAFGSPLLHELDEREMFILAHYGDAVSPVTSFLAIEPGVRPSTEGLEIGEGQGRLGGSHRTIAPRVRFGASSVQDPFDRGAFLRDQLAAAWRRCGSGTRVAAVTVETTYREVADVRVEPVSGWRDAPARTCLEEAGWAIDLPEAFRASWEGFRFEL